MTARVSVWGLAFALSVGASGFGCASVRTVESDWQSVPLALFSPSGQRETARVRLTGGFEDEGRVHLEANRKTLLIGTRAYPVRDILEVRFDRRSRQRGRSVGAGWGAASGALVGGLVGLSDEPSPCTQKAWCGLATATGIVAGTAAGALLGVMLGGAVGSRDAVVYQFSPGREVGRRR